VTSEVATSVVPETVVVASGPAGVVESGTGARVPVASAVAVVPESMPALAVSDAATVVSV
jgi:hypothetical protein